MNRRDLKQDHSDSGHPSAERLNAFAVGLLAEDDSAEVERHLAACELCGKLLESSPDDSLVALFQEAHSLALSTSMPAASAPTRPLRFVPGYQLLDVLGEGGMGVVWKARQDGLDRLVALKRIRSAGQTSSEALARFRREAEAVARLRHSSIVQIYDVGEQEGEPYLALEYVEGGSLTQKLTAGPLLPRQAAALVETLARAMHHAHEHGIIHRDLKPANVLLADDGAPKITDFGLAKRLGEESGQTHTGAILGTPSYMAPEQAGGDRAGVGPLADVYALGAILYETLTGRPPFRGPTVLDTLAQLREREPVPPRQLQPNVSRDLQTICLKCLQKEPRRRYGSALELAEDLRRFALGEPIRARPVGRVERLRKWIRRKPAQAALAGTVLLVPIGLVGGLLWHNADLRREIVRADSAERKERDNFDKSRQTIHSMVARFEEWYRGGGKNTSQMGEGVVQDALEYLQTVLGNSENADPQVRTDAASLLLKVGRIQAYHGRGEEARINFVKASRLYEQLTGEQPEVSLHRTQLLHCYRGLAQLVSGDDRQRLAWGEKAVELGKELCRREPDDDQHHPTDLAQSHHDLAAQFQNRNRLREAEEHYQQAIRLYSAVLAKHPDHTGCKLGLADSYGNMGLLYHQTGRTGQAEREYQHADVLLEALMREAPNNYRVTASASRSAVALNWGNLLIETGQLGPALSFYEHGIEWCESLLRKEPNYAPAREHALKLHGSKANVYEGLHRYAEAVPHWDRVVELADGPARMEYRLRRALALVRGGDHARATASAVALAAEPNCPPDSLYNVACVLSLAHPAVLADKTLSAAEQRVQARACAEKAVAVLKKLAGNGYFKNPANLNNLRSDADLNPLRQRRISSSWRRDMPRKMEGMETKSKITVSAYLARQVADPLAHSPGICRPDRLNFSSAFFRKRVDGAIFVLTNGVCCRSCDCLLTFVRPPSMPVGELESPSSLVLKGL
jgi:serine/threonine protein kinase